MNDLEFSAKIHQKSREACEVHDHGAGNAVQCDVHNIFAAENYTQHKLPHLTAHLMKHKTKSILRPRTTSEGQKRMISKREHPCLVLFSLEIMFAYSISSKFLCF